MTRAGAIDSLVPGRFPRSFCVLAECSRAIGVNRPYLKNVILALAILTLAGCATTARHQFAAFENDSRVRTGQLLYRNAKATLIGDIIVRLARSGEVELTLSKGPGFTLLTIRQDPKFAEVKGTMAGPGWSGPIEKAPRQLKGWLALGEKIVREPNQRLIRYRSGEENFVVRF